MWWLPELNKGQMVRKPNQYFIAILLSSLSLQILQFIFWSWKCMLIHYRSFTGHLSTGFFTFFFFLTLCYDQISFFVSGVDMGRPGRGGKIPLAYSHNAYFCGRQTFHYNKSPSSRELGLLRCGRLSLGKMIPSVYVI